MKKHKTRKNVRFKATWQYSSASRQRTEEIYLEDLVVAICSAEKQVLPIILQMKVGPAAALFLLAQYTHVFTTGSNELSQESAMTSTNTVLSLWKSGAYLPEHTYPFTLEETLQDIQRGIKAKNDYADSFQAFTPRTREEPRGIGQVSGGIVKHPKTNFWQIWLMLDGPCEYLGAYRDPARAQYFLEVIIDALRRRVSPSDFYKAYTQVTSQSESSLKQLPFAMVEHLLQHLDSYTIHL